MDYCDSGGAVQRGARRRYMWSNEGSEGSSHWCKHTTKCRGREEQQTAQWHIQCGPHQKAKTGTWRRASASQTELFCIILIWWAAHSQTPRLSFSYFFCHGCLWWTLVLFYTFIYMFYLYKFFYSYCHKKRKKKTHNFKWMH